jgi:catechol 2,3-dioxygenase
MGAVHLTVSDLGRSLDYYRRTIGLEVLERGDSRASLGTDQAEELLVLVEEPGAPSPGRSTGLFHFALLLPERADLARWLTHAAEGGVQLTGLSDHFVSEAIYLRDPDAHGIELYWDRPREVWEGQVGQRLTTMPLDVENLLGASDGSPFERLPGGTTMGHVHLKAAGIPETISFYRDLVGFDLTASLGNQAAFLAAGGYHHHIGANTWESAGAPPPPQGSAALRHATILLPTAADRDDVLRRIGEAEETAEGPAVRDPSGNRLVLDTAAPASQ